MKSIINLQEHVNKLADWKKGYLTIILGTPLSSVVIFGVYFALLLPEVSAILNLIFFCIFIVFGLLGGYLAKKEYLRVWAYLVVTFLVFFFGIGIIPISSSYSFIGFFGLFFWSIIGIGFIVVFSIFLLPALAIGSLIHKRQNKKKNKLSISSSKSFSSNV